MVKDALVCILSVALCVSARATENPPEGKSVPALRGILRDGATELERLNAAKALDAMVPAKHTEMPRNMKEAPVYEPAAADVVEALLPGLADPACSVRYVCRKALGRGGPVAVPGLLAALKSGNRYARANAADALADMAQYLDAATLPLDQVVTGLAAALNDDHYSVRVSACLALKHCGRRAEPALPRLIELLSDKEWAVADAAIQAVAAADPSGTRSVPALIGVLENPQHELRQFACAELGGLGPNAKAAIPALTKLLDADKNNWFAGKAAADALMQIVSYDKRETAEDPAADVRPQVIAAIARSVAAHTTPFVRDDRLTALLLPRKRTCPIGKEALPAVPYALEKLRAWMHQPPVKWIPRQGLVDFLAAVGPYAGPQVTATVKELLADETIDQGQGVKQLQDLLKKLEG